MRQYVHKTTGQRLAWHALKKLLHASIPFGCQSIGDWELEPEPEPVEQEEPIELPATLEERVSDLEDAVIELASILTEGE